LVYRKAARWKSGDWGRISSQRHLQKSEGGEPERKERKTPSRKEKPLSARTRKGGNVFQQGRSRRELDNQSSGQLNEEKVLTRGNKGKIFEIKERLWHSRTRERENLFSPQDGEEYIQ